VFTWKIAIELVVYVCLCIFVPLFFYIHCTLVYIKMKNRDTTGNSPTLAQCDKEGVVLYGLHSRDVKR